jgi:hypothetical protein
MQPIINRLLPIPKDSGFRQDGYFIWCGSMIRAEGRYHLFASRWPEGTGDLVGSLDGYRTDSEIVHAVAENPVGPYRFQSVALGGRGGDWWDGQSCHGPKIVKVGDRFVLYYQGIACHTTRRKIGYAWASNIAGPWHRCEHEIPLTEDANNPAPYIDPDGSVLLAYRTYQNDNLAIHIARADAFDGDYETVAENVFPAGYLEDPDLYFADGQYHMIVEDNGGALTGSVRHGGHLVSSDGTHWQPANPAKVYTHTMRWTDGTSWEATRRERPDMFNDNEGVKGHSHPTHLITGVLYQGHSWCVVQEIAPESETDG